MKPFNISLEPQYRTWGLWLALTILNIHYFWILYIYTHLDTILEKPSKPNITGNLNVEVNRYMELTCFSHSTSAPDYYSKLANMSYTWFVNKTRMDGETRETMRLYVTIDLKYNRYSCRATYDNLESDISDPSTLYVSMIDVTSLLCKKNSFIFLTTIWKE